MNKEVEEFKSMLDMLPIDESKKEEVIEHSKVFFEYRYFLKEKHDLSNEAVEKMTNDYVQAKLSESKEELNMVMSGDLAPVCKYAQQQATEEGFEKPIEKSMKIFMDFYKDLNEHINV